VTGVTGGIAEKRDRMCGCMEVDDEMGPGLAMPSSRTARAPLREGTLYDLEVNIGRAGARWGLSASLGGCGGGLQLRSTST
jgi:hypothetical protein